MSLTPIKVLILVFSFILSFVAEARKETEYYTLVGNRATGCGMEGNKIVNGQLHYSGRGGQCRPLNTYCPYGVGHQNNCIVPCVHAAGGSSYRRDQVVRLQKPFRCPWGPHKGQMITHVKIADIGKAVKGDHIDVFKGLCREIGRNKKGQKTGVCVEYASDQMIAQYGRGKNTNSYAEALRSEKPIGGGSTGMFASTSKPAPVTPMSAGGMSSLPNVSAVRPSVSSKTNRTKPKATQKPKRAPVRYIAPSYPSGIPAWAEAAFNGGVR